MSRIIKTWRDPYGEGFSPCRKRQVEIHPGLTVLVGCNGAGKSTLLRNIASELKKEKIPYYEYSNEKEGGTHSIGADIFYGDMMFAASAFCSSEGERISLNLQKLAKKLGNFVKTGEVNDRSAKIRDAFLQESREEITSKERWILLDAMDSGFSIDNVIEMKDFFNFVIEEGAKSGVEVYIVISSNEYELACDADCFDVMNAKYMRFKNYEDYKKFILSTREKKNKRYEKTRAKAKS